MTASEGLIALPIPLLPCTKKKNDGSVEMHFVIAFTSAQREHCSVSYDSIMPID